MEAQPARAPGRSKARPRPRCAAAGPGFPRPPSSHRSAAASADRTRGPGPGPRRHLRAGAAPAHRPPPSPASDSRRAEGSVHAARRRRTPSERGQPDGLSRGRAAHLPGPRRAQAPRAARLRRPSSPRPRTMTRRRRWGRRGGAGGAVGSRGQSAPGPAPANQRQAPPPRLGRRHSPRDGTPQETPPLSSTAWASPRSGSLQAKRRDGRAPGRAPRGTDRAHGAALRGGWSPPGCRRRRAGAAGRRAQPWRRRGRCPASGSGGRTSCA